METKTLLIGMSGSGKTSIANVLRLKHGINVIEIDEEAERLDPSIWVKDGGYINKLFKEVGNQQLINNNVFLVSSFMEPEQIISFKSKGFKIITSYATLDKLLERKQVRGHKLTKARIKRTERNYNELLEIFKKVDYLIDLKLDLNMISTKEAVGLVLETLRRTHRL